MAYVSRWQVCTCVLVLGACGSSGGHDGDAAGNSGSGGQAGAAAIGTGGSAPLGSGGTTQPLSGTGGAGMGDPKPQPDAGKPSNGADAGPVTNVDAGGNASDGMVEVLLVGNSVAGSVSFIDARTFENLGSVSVTPDLDEIMGEISADITRSVAYPAVKNGQLIHHFEPSNGDRFVDDVFVSPDGDVLYVSRSNLGDVAAFDLTKPDHPRLWRTFVDGLKADHATISHDGSELVVSATTATRRRRIRRQDRQAHRLVSDRRLPAPERLLRRRQAHLQQQHRQRRLQRRHVREQRHKGRPLAGPGRRRVAASAQDLEVRLRHPAQRGHRRTKRRCTRSSRT